MPFRSIFDKAWFNKLPKDLQKIFIATVNDMNAASHKADIEQEKEQIKAATEKYGVQFFTLPDNEMKTLIKQADLVHVTYAPEINKLHKGDKYRPANYLKEVQDLMGYKP